MTTVYLDIETIPSQLPWVSEYVAEGVKPPGTIKKAETKRWPGTEFKERMTEVWTYRSLIHNSPLKYFDFISIDAEGVDYEILEQINLKHTQMVCIEHNGNVDLFHLIKDYCNKAGLTKCLLTNLENVIWAR
jgi:hypothetical protein